MESSKFLLLSFLNLAIVSLAQNSPQDYLSAHNQARRAVGVGNLKWDSQLAMYAQNTSNQNIAHCNMIKSEGPYGENIAWKSGADLTGIEAVKQWVEEQSNYDRNSNSCHPGTECRHYTQVVWRNTTHLGCAKVVCTYGGSLITCSYSPAGNVPSQVPY